MNNDKHLNILKEELLHSSSDNPKKSNDPSSDDIQIGKNYPDVSFEDAKNRNDMNKDNEDEIAIKTSETLVNGETAIQNETEGTTPIPPSGLLDEPAAFTILLSGNDNGRLISIRWQLSRANQLKIKDPDLINLQWLDTVLTRCFKAGRSTNSEELADNTFILEESTVKVLQKKLRLGLLVDMEFLNFKLMIETGSPRPKMRNNPNPTNLFLKLPLRNPTVYSRFRGWCRGWLRCKTESFDNSFTEDLFPYGVCSGIYDALRDDPDAPVPFLCLRRIGC